MSKSIIAIWEECQDDVVFFVFTDRDRTVHKQFSSCQMSDVGYLPVGKVNANTHGNVKCMLFVVCCLGMSRVADIKRDSDSSVCR